MLDETLEKTEEMKIAEQAWAHPKTGEVQHFAKHSAIKLRRGVLLMPKLERIRKTLTLPQDHLENPKMAWAHFTVYPKPEHFEQFRNAEEGVEIGGPSMEHPGAIGTVQVTFEKGYWRINYAQAHFTAGHGPAQVERRLAEKYGGWRRRALAQVLKIAKEHKLEVHVSHHALYPYKRKTPGKISSIHNDLIEACKDAGITSDIPRKPGSNIVIRTH